MCSCRLKIKLVIALIMSVTGSFAQNLPELSFDHISSREGLSSNFVTSFAEDKLGFIWIGTSNGLNRYDGFKFKHYYHDNSDSNSLVNNTVNGLYCDGKGRIWISTDNGVSCFIPSKNKFINYHSTFYHSHRLKNNSGVRFYEDQAGSMWLSNQQNAVYKIGNNYELIEHEITAEPFLVSGIKKLGFEEIFRAKNGDEWAFKSNRIYHIDKATKQPAATFNLPGLPGRQPLEILNVYEDNEGVFWISSWGNGLGRFDPASKIFNYVPGIEKGIFAGLTAWTYRNSNFIVSVENMRGLYLIDKDNQQVKNYAHVPDDISSIQGIDFNSLFVDSKNNLWISSNQGVNRVTAGKSIFDVIPVTDIGSSNYDLYKNNTVVSYFDNDSSIWLSKAFRSTFEYDRQFKIIHCYKSLFPLSSQKITYSQQAYYFYRKQEELYISTDDGLIVYNLKNKTSKLYSDTVKNSLTECRTIIPFSENEILIRSAHYGIFIFNTDTKKKWYRFFRKKASVPPAQTCVLPGLSKQAAVRFL